MCILTWDASIDIIYELIHILNFSLATYLYKKFQYQACVYQTKTQYDRSSEILTEMLCLQWCQDSLSPEHIKVIEKFQANMKKKENYLAFHIRFKISMSFDAMITSPIESMNSSLKNGMGVNSNSNTKYFNILIHNIYKLIL